MLTQVAHASRFRASLTSLFLFAASAPTNFPASALSASP